MPEKWWGFAVFDPPVRTSEYRPLQKRSMLMQRRKLQFDCGQCVVRDWVRADRDSRLEHASNKDGEIIDTVLYSKVRGVHPRAR